MADENGNPTGIEGLNFYHAAAMNTGINLNAADLTVGADAINSLPFNLNTYNFSAGRRAGWTTRYGIWPVPGHNSNENGDQIASGGYTGFYLRGLMASEQTPAALASSKLDVYGQRTWVFGAVILALPVAQSPAGATVPMLYWITARTKGAGVQLDLVPATVKIAGGQQMSIRSQPEAQLGSGTAVLSMGQTSFNSTDTTERVQVTQAIDRLHVYDLANLRKLAAAFTQKYIRFATMQMSFATNINEFVGVGRSGADPGVTPVNTAFGNYGIPYWLNQPTQRRLMSISVQESGNYDFVATAPKKWSVQWFFSQIVGDIQGTPSFLNASSVGTLTFSGIPAAGRSFTTSGTWVNNANADMYFMRVNDQPLNVTASLVAMIGSNPMVVICNPYLRDSTEDTVTGTGGIYWGNDFAQWLDPCNNIWTSRQYTTLIMDYSTTYKETWAAAGTAVAVQTCWKAAPVYVFGSNTTNVVTGVGGLLKANTTYEYAYSVYNALTGKESNVGAGAKAYVSADNSAILVHPPIRYPPTRIGSFAASTSQFPTPVDMFGDATSTSGGTPNYAYSNTPVNYLSFRLYYREVGSFEWLFAGEHSFAKIFYEVFGEAIYIGKTGAIGTVGGQPGGFNDYSDLPVDTYIDVLSFRGRLFWLTRGQVSWSRGDDKLSYPAQCTAPAPTGEFRGMVAHFFWGQAEAAGRIVFFTSEGNYEGRFTGVFQQAQVRVSASAQPIAVNIDGSDFQINPRSSDTAFSGRAAVVAEGILYFMGPTGIFRDNGVDPPKRITQAIEPDYFECYDESTTDQCFAYFNKRSREVLFFYRPNPARTDLNTPGYLTKAWVYSLRTETIYTSSSADSHNVVGAWTQYGYTSLIDWAQDLDLTRFEVAPHAGGARTLTGIRRNSVATVSRAYYHDDRCEGGDYKPGDELMVKEIQRPNASTVRFVLAAGYSSTILAALTPAVSRVSVAGSKLYGDMSATAGLNVDGFYLVKAVNSGAGTLDIDSTGITGVIAQTFTQAQYFPLFIEGTHDVVCKIQTNYLAPNGIFRWNLVRYMHLLTRPVTQGAGAEVPRVTFQWEPNHQQGVTTATKTASVYPLNARETTTQIVSDIVSPDSQASAQAVRTTMTYNQVVGRWTFFSMTHYYMQQGDDETKYYEQ